MRGGSSVVECLPSKEKVAGSTPVRRSKSDRNMIYKNKSIGFAPNLVPLINNGTKTLTYRLGDKYDFLKIGDLIDARDSSNDRVFAQVEITEKSWIPFKDLPTDRNGHEIYSSKNEQRETFKEYYGKDLEDEDRILILGFKVVKS